MTKLEKSQKILTKLKKLFPNTKIALNYNNPIELFISVILSAQTTDKQVNLVTEGLFKKYRSINDYVNVPLLEFEQDIKRIGLYRAKAKNIKSALQIIDKNYQGKIPDSMNELIKLPGVGRKSANVLIYIIYNKNEGIAVDTHVRRLSQLFGLSNSNNPDLIERDLMDLIPRNDWGEITYLLIEYGRKYCPAHCKHLNCPLKSFISTAN